MGRLDRETRARNEAAIRTAMDRLLRGDYDRALRVIAEINAAATPPSKDSA